MHTLNETIQIIRAVVSRAGETDRLGWWPSALCGSTGRMVFARIFPRSTNQAAFRTLTYGIRHMEGSADPKNGLISLFYLGGQRETLLENVNAEVSLDLLDRHYSDGKELASVLLDLFKPVLGEASGSMQFRENPQRNHVEVGHLTKLPRSEDELRDALKQLIRGLSLSTPGRYLPPVIRISEKL